MSRQGRDRTMPITAAHLLVVERAHTLAFWEWLERINSGYAGRQPWLKAHGGR